MVVARTTDAPVAATGPEGLELLQEWLAHRADRIAEEGERTCDPELVAPGHADVALCRRLFAPES